MECNFTVGQKVVCVVDDWPSHVVSPIRKGCIYTIAEILPPDLSFSFDGVDVRASIRLTEAKNNLADVDSFNPARFQPLVTRKTDISIFTDMLIEQKQPVEA